MAELIACASVETLNAGDVMRYFVRQGRGLYGGMTGVCRIEKFVEVPKRKPGPGYQVFTPGDWLIHITPLYESGEVGPETRYQPGDIWLAPKDSTSEQDWLLYDQPGSAFLDTLRTKEIATK